MRCKNPARRRRCWTQESRGWRASSPAAGSFRDAQYGVTLELLVERAARLLEPRLGGFPRLLAAAVRCIAEVGAGTRARTTGGHLVAQANKVAVRPARLLVDAADSRAGIRRRCSAAATGAGGGLRRGLAAATTAGAACGGALAGAFAGRHRARGCRAGEQSCAEGPFTTGATLSFSNLSLRAETSIANFDFWKICSRLTNGAVNSRGFSGPVVSGATVRFCEGSASGPVAPTPVSPRRQA